jgi:hypothetical protein
MSKNRLLSLCFSALFFLGCQGGGGEESSSIDTPSTPSSPTQNESKYTYTYDGMPLYARHMSVNHYKLEPLTDSEFNALDDAAKIKVADKLLSTLYFGMPYEQLRTLIDSGTFISSIQTMIHSNKNDMAAVEARLQDSGQEDEQEFYFSSWPDGSEEISRILARFYVMEHLDQNYIDHWSAYVLTSTIMFSPAYELASSHAENIERVYSALVRNQRDEYSVQYSTFSHMISDDNWRRFRSPEDNGREMMEIYLLDFDDAHVPIAGKALQNWKLDRDNDTLVVSLNENTTPLQLFGTSIQNGYDFYRALTMSKAFLPGITQRLVALYFPKFNANAQAQIVSKIVASNPKTWQDILLQIALSKSYLLDSEKLKSAEELFFSLSKKIYFQHRRRFFSQFATALSNMNQAPMKYKLGKYSEVPLDTQSFLTYHKAMRESVLIRYHNTWSSGWLAEKLIPDTIFEGISAYEHEAMLERLMEHLFLSTLSRYPTEEEKAFFKGHMLNEGEYVYAFELFRNGDDPLSGRKNATVSIFDYISRLAELYTMGKVN